MKYNLRNLIYTKSITDNKKITYADISEKTGISINTLSKMSARKDTNVTVDTVIKLCQYFNCTPNELISGFEQPTSYSRISKGLVGELCDRLGCSKEDLIKILLSDQ